MWNLRISKLEYFLAQALGGYLAVLFFYFDPDGFAAQVFRGAERGAAAHEGVED